MVALGYLSAAAYVIGLKVETLQKSQIFSAQTGEGGRQIEENVHPPRETLPRQQAAPTFKKASAHGHVSIQNGTQVRWEAGIIKVMRRGFNNVFGWLQPSHLCG